ncbi:hypothetical protein ACLOJK_020626 [Asimina triloba]
MAKPSEGRTAEETVTPRRQAARSLTRAWKGHKMKSRNKGGSQQRAKEELVGFLTNKISQGCRVADDGGAGGIDDLKKASRGFPHTGYASCQKGYQWQQSPHETAAKSRWDSKPDSSVQSRGEQLTGDEQKEQCDLAVDNQITKSRLQRPPFSTPTPAIAAFNRGYQWQQSPPKIAAKIPLGQGEKRGGNRMVALQS